jgi:hypothetical protein
MGSKEGHDGVLEGEGQRETTLKGKKKKLLKILLGGRDWGGRGSELGELN